MRVIGAYRETDVHADDPMMVLLADLACEGLMTQSRLDSLSPEEATELLEYVLAEGANGAQRNGAQRGEQSATGVPIASIAREEVLRRAEGVPFFLISCAQALVDGVLRQQQSADTADAPVPWSVAQSIRVRVAVLPEATREVLSLASVVGRVVPVAILVALSGRSEADVLTLLDAAWHLGLLAEVGKDYQFAHDLIREVLAADLSAARRAVLHRRVGEALEHMSASQPEGGHRAAELAYHTKPARVVGVCRRGTRASGGRPYTCRRTVQTD